MKASIAYRDREWSNHHLIQYLHRQWRWRIQNAEAPSRCRSVLVDAQSWVLDFVLQCLWNRAMYGTDLWGRKTGRENPWNVVHSNGEALTRRNARNVKDRLTFPLLRCSWWLQLSIKVVLRFFATPWSKVSWKGVYAGGCCQDGECF